jgi:hypothetical protein
MNGIHCINVRLIASSLKSEVYVYQALHIFSKNLGPTSKFQAPERWHEDKRHTKEQKKKLANTVTNLVNMATSAPGICAPLIVNNRH